MCSDTSYCSCTMNEKSMWNGELNDNDNNDNDKDNYDDDDDDYNNNNRY